MADANAPGAIDSLFNTMETDTPAPGDTQVVVEDASDPVLAAAKAPEDDPGEAPVAPAKPAPAGGKVSRGPRTRVQMAQRRVDELTRDLPRAKRELADATRAEQNPDQYKKRSLADLNRRARLGARAEDAEREQFRELFQKYGVGERKRPMPPQPQAKK